MYLKRRTLEGRVRRMRLRAKGEAAAPHVKLLVRDLTAACPGRPPVEEAGVDHEDANRSEDGLCAAEDSAPRNRHQIAVEVAVRKAGGFSFQLRAFDVSPSGCKVELVEAVEPSERVIVRLPALEPMGAEVAWVDGNQAGLRFERPLHAAVFDHLMGRLATCAA